MIDTSRPARGAAASAAPNGPASGPGPRRQGAIWVEALPADLARIAPMDVAEVFRDLPGLALLESARPGRRSRWSYLTADPVATQITTHVGGELGSALFDEPRVLLGRLAREATPEEPGADEPRFAGGLVGYLGYDVGLDLEPRPTIASDDQDLPLLRLALHDWAIAWDRASGAAWICGRAVDGDRGRLERRVANVRDRLDSLMKRQAELQREGPSGTAFGVESPRFVSNLDRTAFESRVDDIREAIARGEIYQANLTRRLTTPFAGDPWPLYRRLRTGDPAMLAGFLDLGPTAAGTSRAIVSASPEPFLSIDRRGRVATDPIKGTRPRGRDRADDRRLACELLTSEKDRAENTMIVDVLRNDLGRVCRPGSVRVPRLCRLERTAAVQHLVSTVTGELAAGRDAFDVIAAAFPGGSITGAPKLRAMDVLERLETVRRGPYTGALGWIGPDGALAMSILIRTFVADGRRLSLSVGGGITWRSVPADEWDETVAKASGPLAAIGAVEVSG